MKTIAISIPKPCHEDWNKMTPDVKGAFCGSCQKSVHDFSTKTDEEIISVFEKEGEGKVCGRFAPSQLSRPVISFGNANTTGRLTQFLCALMLVFGAALFTGDAFGQTVKGECKVMGRLSVISMKPPVETVKDTVVEMPAVDMMPLGQATIMRDPEPVKTQGDTVVMDVPKQIDIDTMEDTEEEITMIDTTAYIEPLTTCFVAGAVSYTVIEINEIEPDVIDTVADSTAVVPITEEEQNNTVDDNTEIKSTLISETILPPTSEFIVSPNPSKGEIMLSYTLKNDMPVRIDLFDNNGKFIKTLANQEKQYAGKYNVAYNLSELKNGIYNAVLITAERKSTAKVIIAK